VGAASMWTGGYEEETVVYGMTPCHETASTPRKYKRGRVPSYDMGPLDI